MNSVLYAFWLQSGGQCKLVVSNVTLVVSLLEFLRVNLNGKLINSIKTTMLTQIVFNNKMYKKYKIHEKIIKF